MNKLFFTLMAASCLLAACDSKTAETNAGDSTAIKLAANTKTAMAIEEAIIKKDVDGIYKYCAKDFVDYGNGEMKAVTNLDSLKIGMKQFVEAFPDLKADNLKAVAQGDTVIVTGLWSGTFKKDFMGIKATNKAFKAPDADIFVFNKDGQLTSKYSIQGEATYFTQLGITLPDKK